MTTPEKPKWSPFELLFSVAAGAAIWAFSPVVTGHVEPWDAQSGYFVIALIGAGVGLGFVFPRRLWSHYLGVFVGQLTYMLFFLGPLGPLIGVGVSFLVGYSLIAFAGAGAGAAIRKFVDLEE